MIRQQPITAKSNDPNIAAVYGEHTAGQAVRGVSKGSMQSAVVGINENNTNTAGAGIFGESQTVGVMGIGREGQGVWGETRGTHPNSTGVYGIATRGKGVFGRSINGSGIYGFSERSNGITAESHHGTAFSVINHGASGLHAMEIRQLSGLGALLICYGPTREVFKVAENGVVSATEFRLSSDKNAKENFSSVNTLEILNKLESMPIQSWSYKDDMSSVRHIGPTAQDFQATFGFNEDDDTHISSIDLQGVALAAIQGLNEKLKAENEELHAKLANLEERLLALESKG